MAHADDPPTKRGYCLNSKERALLGYVGLEEAVNQAGGIETVQYAAGQDPYLLAQARLEAMDAFVKQASQTVWEEARSSGSSRPRWADLNKAYSPVTEMFDIWLHDIMQDIEDGYVLKQETLCVAQIQSIFNRMIEVGKVEDFRLLSGSAAVVGFARAAITVFKLPISVQESKIFDSFSSKYRNVILPNTVDVKRRDVELAVPIAIRSPDRWDQGLQNFRA